MLAARERVRRALAITVAAIGALTFVAVPAGPASHAVTTTPTADITVAPVTPVLGDGDDLVVAIETTTAAAQDRSVRVQLATRSVTTRTEFTRWLAGETGGPILSTVATATLRAGSTTLQVTVPADEVPVPTGVTGALALEVQVDGSAPARSFVTADLAAGGPTGIAITMPTAAPTNASGLLDAEQLGAATAPGGALATQLAVAQRGVALGVDPMIPASLAALGEEAPASARQWMDDVRALSETFAIPYAGGDPVVIARSGITVPSIEGIPASDGSLLPPALAEVPTTGIPVVDATASTVDAALLGTLDDTTVVVSTADLEEQLGSQTPGAHVRIGEASVLAADDELERFVRMAVHDDETTARDGTARAMALLATITLEAPSLQRTLVATLPRTANPTAAAALLDAISGAGWLDETDLAEALGTPPRQGTLIERAPTDDEQRAAGRVAELAEIGAAPEAFRSALEDPAAVFAPLRLQVLAAIAAGSRPDGAAEVAALRQVVEPLVRPATIVNSSDALIVSASADLPVTLENRLDAPLTVAITVETGTATVVVDDEPIIVELSPGGRERVAVPTEVVAAGSGVVRITMTTEDGVEIDSATIRITTQPALEMILLIIAGTAVVLLLGFGIWRSLRKRRRGQAHGDMDQAATTAEDGIDSAAEQERV